MTVTKRISTTILSACVLMLLLRPVTATEQTLQLIVDALDNDDITYAQTEFERLSITQKNSFAGKTIQGRLMMGQDQYDEAESFFEGVIAQYPDNAEAHYLFGAVNIGQAQRASIFSKLGYAEAGLEHLQKSVALDPNHLKSHELLSQFYNHAPSIAGGDVDKARQHAERVKKLDAEKGILLLAGVAGNHDDEDAALTILTSGIEQLPTSSKLHYHLALRYQQLEDWEATRSALAKAIDVAQAPDDQLRAQYQVARTAVLSEQNTEQGLKAMAEVIVDVNSQSNISLDWAHYRTAQLYLLQNDKVSASKHYEIAMQNTDDSDLEKRLKKMKKQLQ